MTGTLRSAIAELVGTFIFAFAVVGAVNGASPRTPLVIGVTLLVLGFATGHISGAHLNPAVSVGVWLRGAINVATLIFYVIAQLVGAALGAALSLALWPVAKAPMHVAIGPAFLVEALWTLVLAYVVLNVATSKDNANNSFYGLAIGSTVFVGAVAVGGISGGGFNPAIALGLSITGHFEWSAYWLYFLAPIVGAIIAAIIFRVLNADDKLPQTVAEAESEHA